MAREELLDSKLVSVILLESQCAAATDGKNIKAHKHSLATITGPKGDAQSLRKLSQKELLQEVFAMYIT